MKRKRNFKILIGVAAALVAIAIIAGILLTGENTPPDGGEPTSIPSEASASPGMVIIPPVSPSAEPGGIDNSPEPGSDADDDRPADLIVDVNGGDSDNPSVTGNPAVQPDAKPLEPIPPMPSASEPPKLPADDDQQNPSVAPSEPQPSIIPAEPPAKPLEPVQPDEPISDGVVPTEETPEPYNCDTKNHHCDTPEKHAYTVNLEIEGCTYCGSHSCTSFYALNEWGYTSYTPSKCPKYNISQDPVYTCQNCGKPTGDGTNGTCVQFVNDATCPNCGRVVHARTCHSCD